VDRAYAILSLKKLDGAERTISGVASTPTADRHGDIFEPLGATFTNPLPLLLHHDSERPVGRATLRATRTGIVFEATIPDIKSAGALRDRVTETCDLIDAGLIRAVSIGYRVLSDGVQFLKSGGRHLLKTEICELSLVTIPANAETTIHAIKSFDAPHLAAFGRTQPGVSGQPLRVSSMKQTTAEQITNCEHKRASLVAAMTELMTKASDSGTTLDAEQGDEYDGLDTQVKSLDADLRRLRTLEQLNANAAVPANGGNGHARPFGSVSIVSNAPKGQAFIRMVKTLVEAKGDSYRAFEISKQYKDPGVELMVKAAVAPGSTLDPAWAQALVQINQLTGEFIDLLRPATILGKIPGLTRVPFNTQVPIQTAGGTYKWVGQAKSKPVGKLQFGTATLGMAKAAGIIVLTDELIKSSNPSAEEIVKRDMVAGIAQFLDQQFTDPAVAEVAQTSPASITNGAGTAASQDDPAKDLGAIISFFNGQNVPLKGITILMSSQNAYAMGVSRNPLGQSLFAGVGIDGGSANGVSIIASNTVGDKVIGLVPEYILYADDGGVQIDVSREATLQMNDAPATPADPATAVWTSMFQDNLTALRAERFINWKRATPNAVYYLTGAVYPI
jgi:HK97 family phage major capsid protein/HK97 family phage prohead protease